MNELERLGHKPTGDGDLCLHRWRNRTTRAVHCAFLRGYRAALASTSIDGVSGTGLEDGPWKQRSDAADDGPWTFDGERIRTASGRAIADVRYAHNRANAELVVAAVNHVRATLAKGSDT